MMKSFFTTAAIIIGALAVQVVQAQPDQPTLSGQTFKITLIEADGFVTIDDTAPDGYSGYIIDMIANVAAAADFKYELSLPSGFGSQCTDGSVIIDANSTEPDTPYDDVYASAYLCGEDDTLDPDVPEEYSTDMYWSMYYVTNQRQLLGKFSLPFKPPTSGLTMYGTATDVESFDDLMGQQKDGSIGPACVGANTAYANWLADAIPSLQTVDVINTEDGFRQALVDGNCTVLINAEHAAYHFIKNSAAKDSCEIDGTPVGIIGDGLSYGLTQMAIGFNSDTPPETIDAISYYLNELMTCAPNTDGCDGSLYTSWIKNAGTGNDCGYDGSGGGDSSTTDKSSGGYTDTIIGYGTTLIKAAMIGFLV